MFHPFTLNLKGRLYHYSRPQVMGIVNVTPDSFYGGSRTTDCSDIAARIERMIADGVDFIDMGAYSSRSGAEDVPVSVEMERLQKGMSILRLISSDIPVSIDTFRAEVAKVAVNEFGADIINDISGGTLDEDMFQTVANLNVPYVLMHMRGNPATMQSMVKYDDVTADVIDDLSEKLRKLRLLGVSDVIIDPGFGFSKTLEQNFELMKDLRHFEVLDCPVLVGVSRKSMITRSLGIATDDALAPTIALETIALTKGAAFIRVHDVKEAAQAIKLVEMTNE